MDWEVTGDLLLNMFFQLPNFLQYYYFYSQKNLQVMVTVKGRHFSLAPCCHPALTCGLHTAHFCSAAEAVRTSLTTSTPALHTHHTRHSTDMTHAALTHQFLFCACSAHLSVKLTMISFPCPSPSTKCSIINRSI